MPRGGARKGAGRPPSGKADGFWHIRVTEAVRAEVAAAAEAAGVPESQFIRDAAIREARRRKPHD